MKRRTAAEASRGTGYPEDPRSAAEALAHELAGRWEVPQPPSGAAAPGNLPERAPGARAIAAARRISPSEWQ